MRHSLFATAAAALALSAFLSPALHAQPNAIPGLDIRAYEVGTPTVYGRRGTYPNGEAGIGIGHSMCNSGTVNLTWVGTSGGVMVDTYPKIAFLLARERDGRMEQVSLKGHLKHSRTAYNFSSGPCAPCTGSGGFFWVGCSDTYSTGFNGNRYNLGPTDEVDPWLGSWNPQGSYFDRGDPAVAPPQDTDRVQSLTSSQTSAFDAVKNRMVVPESRLVQGGTYHGQVHLMIKGEPVANRANNLISRPISLAWNGSSWSIALNGTATVGSVLTRWSGATTALGGNGGDDGRFLVACKVTGPVDGVWHYEYAVHNVDNHRGAATLRVPLCDGARMTNAATGDIDLDPLNDWSVSRGSGEVAFLAGAGNALDWNSIYNFWFDSDAAPVAGTVTLDQARVGPGAASVTVAAQVPGRLGHAYLGDGCGTPAPRVSGSGLPDVPSPSHALVMQSAPGASVVFALSMGGANLSLGNGCVGYLDAGRTVGAVARTADGAGRSTWSLPIPAGLPSFDVFVQGAEAVTGGPIGGALALSNGLRVRVGGTGCN